MTMELTASPSNVLCNEHSGISEHAAKEIGVSLAALLADLFAVYVKTKNFHWHVTGPHFHDYHRMFDEQANQILGSTDLVAERARKLGVPALKSISDIASKQRVRDNDDAYVPAPAMLSELQQNNRYLAEQMRGLHELCEELSDIATAGLIETLIDEAEQRAWFLQASQAMPSG
ncbi:DNA starvation/stationary phase protection protein [uncultured Hyphomonas sp.]|uniref:Dps family protein n=1 Tax=uncultured Hyphomonas sp. TaxID=225298 RepID=UPI002AAC27F3|nr:DNA starvation/stationary phase protection protein [uncultured Hyphomonas sp.]